MNVSKIIAVALLAAALPYAAQARGGGGGGMRAGGFSRPSGGFDMHGDMGAAKPPQSVSHSSTGAAGTTRTTTATNTGGGYSRTTNASNGDYNRTTTAGASGGQYNKSSTASTGNASHTSSSSANANTGNYSRNASGSNATGSYNTSASGNAYNHTYNKSTNAGNVYGQTYHGSTSANNGVVSHSAYGTTYAYHGAYVVNPVYAGYPVWGWNNGVAWYPASAYWGGGFWGAWAWGATTAAVYGSLMYNNQPVYSYEVQPTSPGATLLSNYHLTQTQCGPPDLVVIQGPNNSLICAKPNDLVAAGNYTVNAQNLSLQSQK